APHERGCGQIGFDIGFRSHRWTHDHGYLLAVELATPGTMPPGRCGGVGKSCPGRTVLRRRDDASAAELPATTYRTADLCPTICEAVIGRLNSDRNDLVDGADHGYRHDLHRAPHRAAAGFDALAHRRRPGDQGTGWLARSAQRRHSPVQSRPR